MTRLILPLPPSANHSHRNVSNGKRLMRIRTTVTKEYQTEAAWLAKAWATSAQWSIPPKGQQIIVSVWLYWADNRKRDADNALKVSMDAMTGILWVDDRWILPRVMAIGVDKGNPRMEIQVEEE